MKQRRSFVFVAVLGALLSTLLATRAADPLRVFIRAGIKTHGPGQHDHPRFLEEWTQLLTARGLKVDGAMKFPTAQQLEQTDVVIVFAADGMHIVGEDRANFEKYLQRGGGLVVIHDGVVAAEEHEWAKKVQGGAWIWPKNAPGKTATKWLEGEVGLYFVNPDHPIVKGISNFDWKDEIYYDLDMAPDVNVLATSFESVFILAPQLWTYEKTWDGGTKPYRAFVSIPGHEFASFALPQYRAILLRGLAWAGHRENLDEYCLPAEVAEKTLRYPAGGPTEPSKAAARINVHPEFNLRLAASEPLVEKVMSIDWDPQGRLWVVETPEYPGGRTINRNDSPIALRSGNKPDTYARGEKEEERIAKDRVSWLEDTDGDGIMDKKHVFADFEHGVPGGLELATSLVFYKDGVIVTAAPDIWWLRDTDGDGVCDKAVKLYTGFGNFDTHAVMSNLRWGMDGWVYSAVGYSAGHPVSPDGSKDFGKITAGIFRFKPDGSALEQVASGSCNTWGFDFAPDGELFYTTATCGEHFLHVVMPEKFLSRGNIGGIRASAVLPDHQKAFPPIQHKRMAYLQIDWVGGFTASAGSCIYNGGAWPERFNRMHFSTEPTINLVHNDVLSPKGSTYTASKEASREETEFIGGTDLWFRPIHTRVGPDGALYVVDFYNQAVVHNDTRGPKHGARNAATRPDRDHHFARLWRVQHNEARALPAWKLDPADPAGLVSMLDHPNGWVRDTAVRLLTERPDPAAAAALATAARSGSTSYARIAALWTLSNWGKLDEPVLQAALTSEDAVVAKNAFRLIADRPGPAGVDRSKTAEARLHDPDARVKIQALMALSSEEPTPAIARMVVAAWPTLEDGWLQSAAVGVAAKDPTLYVETALAANAGAAHEGLIRHCVRALAQKGNVTQAAQLVVLLGRAPASADGQKQVALETLTATWKSAGTPEWTPELQAAFTSLLHSANPSVPGAALPLLASWDKSGALASEVKPLVAALSAKLADPSLSEDARAQVAINLLGVRHLDGDIIPNVAKLTLAPGSAPFHQRVIEAIGATGDAMAGRQLVKNYPDLSTEAAPIAFGQILKRADWTLQLLAAVEHADINWHTLGPAAVHRLRTHADKGVAERAGSLFDRLRGPEEKEKDKLIASLLPTVEKAGDPANGKKLFEQNCAVCHTFKGNGRNLAPDLTGMGVHGAHELLTHIVDPNRLVEPNFIAVSIETKDDLTYDGIVAGENRQSVKLRNATGDIEIRTADIRSRKLTGRSLMPDGFEALGGEGLRDIIAYISADDTRFRIIDLAKAFTADSTKGIYASRESTRESLVFKKFGLVKAGAIPFQVVNPSRSPSGYNLIVLKGRNGISKDYPRRVEVPVNQLKATRLHILGNVGGWAATGPGDESTRIPVTTFTVTYADGGTESFTLTNGVHMVDYINPALECTGSKLVDGIVTGGQVRLLTHTLKRKLPITSVALESFENHVAPTFVALTAEVDDGTTLHADASGATGVGTDASTAAPAALSWGPGLHTLLVGGGASHDYPRWFGQEDTALLSEGGLASVHYTEDTASVGAALKDVDVLVISANKPISDPATRQAIFAHVQAGKGLILDHPGLWYNWADWPEFNRELCGGGARGHDRLGEFTVTRKPAQHPIMEGLPDTFAITDELYWFESDPKGTAIDVLATAHSKQKDRDFPMIFVVKHPRARIVGITLGHDGRAHELPVFRTLLRNSVKWVAAK